MDLEGRMFFLPFQENPRNEYFWLRKKICGLAECGNVRTLDEAEAGGGGGEKEERSLILGKHKKLLVGGLYRKPL